MKKRNIGVIIGRFQTPILHAGHLYLIGTALQECDEVLILLGDSKKTNKRNPYDVKTRVKLINKIFPNVKMIGLCDLLNDDNAWSNQIDDFLSWYYRNSICTLYHSRDSFKKSYTGIYPLKELPEIPGFSATQIRKQLKQ
jgi:bifunctional NMN adenylyltransferase/nudix hydrolase